jgi:hypothetical protein
VSILLLPIAALAMAAAADGPRGPRKRGPYEETCATVEELNEILSALADEADERFDHARTAAIAMDVANELAKAAKRLRITAKDPFDPMADGIEEIAITMASETWEHSDASLATLRSAHNLLWNTTIGFRRVSDFEKIEQEEIKRSRKLFPDKSSWTANITNEMNDVLSGRVTPATKKIILIEFGFQPKFSSYIDAYLLAERNHLQVEVRATLTDNIFETANRNLGEDAGPELGRWFMEREGILEGHVAQFPIVATIRRSLAVSSFSAALPRLQHIEKFDVPNTIRIAIDEMNDFIQKKWPGTTLSAWKLMQIAMEKA